MIGFSLPPFDLIPLRIVTTEAVALAGYPGDIGDYIIAGRPGSQMVNSIC
jgi:hypothetical protein